MTWDACASRYSNAEEMLAAYSARRVEQVKQWTPKVKLPTPPEKRVNVDNSCKSSFKSGQSAANKISLERVPVRIGKIRVRRLVRLVCALNKVEPMDFFSNGRGGRLSYAREAFARYMNRRGFSEPRIGKLIGRDPSTIHYYLSGRRKHFGGGH